jgi:DNA primase
MKALRHAAPIVANIRDVSLRSVYTRELSRWLGMQFVGEDQVARAVGAAAKRAAQPAQGNQGNQSNQGSQANQGNQGGQGNQAGRGSHGDGRRRTGHFDGNSGAPRDGRETPPDSHSGQERPDNMPQFRRPDPRDPVARMEREALEVVLQYPQLLDETQWERFGDSRFSVPAYAALHDAVRAAGTGGTDGPGAASNWVERVRQEVPETLRGFVSELAVTPLPAKDADALTMYCRDILNRLSELRITRLKAEKLSTLQRLDPSADPALFQQLNRELMELEMERRALRSD